MNRAAAQAAAVLHLTAYMLRSRGDHHWAPAQAVALCEQVAYNAAVDLQIHSEAVAPVIRDAIQPIRAQDRYPVTCANAITAATNRRVAPDLPMVILTAAYLARHHAWPDAVCEAAPDPTTASRALSYVEGEATHNGTTTTWWVGNWPEYLEYLAERAAERTS